MYIFGEHNIELGLHFTIWIKQEEAVLHNTWFSYGDDLYLDGTVNKQSVQFWASRHPYQFHGGDDYGINLLYMLP
jgi:hypothetical protein